MQFWNFYLVFLSVSQCQGISPCYAILEWWIHQLEFVSKLVTDIPNFRGPCGPKKHIPHTYTDICIDIKLTGDESPKLMIFPHCIHLMTLLGPVIPPLDSTTPLPAEQVHPRSPHHRQGDRGWGHCWDTVNTQTRHDHYSSSYQASSGLASEFDLREGEGVVPGLSPPTHWTQRCWHQCTGVTDATTQAAITNQSICLLRHNLVQLRTKIRIQIPISTQNSKSRSLKAKVIFVN